MNEKSSGSDPREDSELRRFESKLEEARKELLETTTRSRLLHTPFGSSRTKIIEIQNELAEQVFRILVHEGRATSFLPSREEAEDEVGVLPLTQPDDESVGAAGIARHHTETRLQTALSSEKLQARLRGIAYDAQTIESEQGVNILYVALGFLKWYEPKEFKKPRYAPLILVPVRLNRAGATERFKITYSGEDLGTNLSLQQRLKAEGIDFPDLPDPDDLSPNAYAADVAKRVSGLAGWEVQRDRIALGFFSFAKLMMYRDLDPDMWPLNSGLRDHPIIRGLLGEGFRSQREPLLPDDTPIDPLIDISTAAHVVDADSSQMLAIEDARNGRNLIIQGPPGTGKSQTITNLIASAVQEGKRVLFVAEKMAALNVVRNNLDRIGLGQMCLELHSHKAKKKVVLADLEQTYQLAGARRMANSKLAEDLRAARDVLNDHVKRMHTPLEPLNITPFEVFTKLARLAGSGVPPPDFQLPAAQGWTRPDMDDRTRSMERLAAHVEVMGVPARHPWLGANIPVVLPQDAERIAARAQKLYDAVAELVDRSEALGACAGASILTLAEAWEVVRLGEILGRAPDLDTTAIGNEAWVLHRKEIAELVAKGSAYTSVRRQLGATLVPEVWDQDLTGIRRAFTEHGHSWLRWLRADYRLAVKRFEGLHMGAAPKRLPQRLKILNDVSTGQIARQYVRELNEVGASAFGRNWIGDCSDWARPDVS